MKRPDQKTVTVGTKSFDAMWAEIAANAKEEKPPRGSMNAREFSAKYGIPLERVRHRLAREVDAGRMTVKSVKVYANGQTHAIHYYTPIRKV